MLTFQSLTPTKPLNNANRQFLLSNTHQSLGNQAMHTIHSMNQTKSNSITKIDLWTKNKERIT